MRDSLVFVALALGGAALVLSLVGRSSNGLGAGAAPVAVGADSGAALAVKELAAENAGLRERLLALEMASGPVGRAATGRVNVVSGAVTRAEFDALRHEVREALAARGSIAGALVLDPLGFKEQVASTLDQIRRDESVATVRAKEEERVRQLDQVMPKLDVQLELSPQQSRLMRSALLTQYGREADLTRRLQAGEDTQVLGELKRSDYEAHQSELSGFLSLDQLERYAGSRRAGGK